MNNKLKSAVPEMEDFCIIIFCHKKDFFLAQILVASIRYFYPTVEIYLCKDLLNGNFHTNEMENFWKVKILDLVITKFGWSAAKMHFYLSDKLKGKKALLLDADIVFTGRVLDRLIPLAMKNDVIVSDEYHDGNEGEWLKKQYYDIDIVQRMHPDFRLPGYYFNCGQLVARSQLFTINEVKDVFDPNNFPFWLNRRDFPLVDQGVLNYLLPYKAQKNEIKIAKDKYYIWIDTDAARQMDLNDIIEGEKNPYMIHWAGNERIPFVYGMIRGDILVYFQKLYFDKIPFGQLKRFFPLVPAGCNFFVKSCYRGMRKKYRQLKSKLQ
ncbi:MAG: putative nucleotide-diphospho-sugar transferase [Bacteroidota bacterium]|nr:putative nucleotide-diphospho-sugar transferase [Bacteroidota bacterium]